MVTRLVNLGLLRRRALTSLNCYWNSRFLESVIEPTIASRA